ncbi:MAG: hypothetical protein L6Q99_18100 [Planctomycetes bacterium]|nr:hypothetical protein [Planctomycetota bacterium]
MTSADALSRALVAAAFEFHRARPWLAVPMHSAILMRVPDEDHTLVACVLGQSGEDHGVLVLRGERALEQWIELVTCAREDGLDFLNLRMDVPSNVPAKFGAAWRAAGIEAGPDELVPGFLARTPRARGPRGLSRADERTMLAVLVGLRVALARGEIRATTFSPQLSRLPEVTVVRDDADFVVRTREVVVRDVVDRACAALLAVPEDLPRREERWVAGTLLTTGRRFHDGERHVIVLHEDDERPLAYSAISVFDDEAIVRLFAALLRGEGLDLPAGAPQEVLFTDEHLAEVATPWLVEHGVTCALVERHPLFDRFDAEAEELAERVRRDEERSEHEQGLPRTGADWSDAHQRIAPRFVERLDRALAALDRPATEYFGDLELAAEVIATLADEVPLLPFLEWAAAAYRETPGAPTFVERELARDDLSSVERALLEARRDARVSVFRVIATRPGESFDVEDLLDGSRRTIHDRVHSSRDFEGACVAFRILDVGSYALAVRAGPTLGASDWAHALGAFAAHGIVLSPELLRENQHFLGRLWEVRLERATGSPRYTNVDDEPVLLHHAMFRVGDRAATEAALAERPDLRFAADEGRWKWRRFGDFARGLGQAVVLGNLTFHDDRLLLEVNSAARFERARSWIEALPGGVVLERVTTKEHAPDDAPLDDRLASATKPRSAEDTALLARAHRESCLRWLDECLPMLGGRTPREVAASARGREQVALLIRAMPPLCTEDGPLEPPREELLEAIGVRTRR